MFSRKISLAGVLPAAFVGLVVGSPAAQAAPASGTCSVSVTVSSPDELVVQATATCNKAKSVSVRARIYYCNWVDPSKGYVLKDSKTSSVSSTVTGTKKAPNAHTPGLQGKYYGEAYVYYTKGGVKYSKSALKFANIGSSSQNSRCPE